MPHSMTQKVNTYALKAFRDTADKDYIHARMAYKAALYPQFLWSSLHALEKYAKCILILTRVPKPQKREDYINHEVNKAIVLLYDRVDIILSEQTKNFICRLENGAEDRYLGVSWVAQEVELAVLDKAVWELRRYCNSSLYIYSDNDFLEVKPNAYDVLKLIDKPIHQNTHISGGFIEETLKNKESSARPELVWSNLYYNNSNRKSVKMKTYPLMFENSPFCLYPEIIDEVAKYSFVSSKVRNTYKNR